MPFAVTHRPDPSSGRYVVTAKVSLSIAETNELFLSGDSIISWPEGDLLEIGESGSPASSIGRQSGLVRTGMFISELARLTEGLKIGYRQAAEAERAAHLLRLQLLKAGIKQET